MPIKLGKSTKKFNKAKKNNFEYDHDYIKKYTKADLIDKYNSPTTIPKKKRKIKNELVRRGGVEFKSELQGQ
jgi:hypothetical protein